MIQNGKYSLSIKKLDQIMTQEKLLYTTVMLEQLLRIYKTQLFHEIKLDNINEIQLILDNAKTSKERKAMHVRLSKIKKHYNEKIRIADKYNQEVTSVFLKTNDKKFGLEFVEENTDFFNDLVSLIFEKTNNASIKNVKKFKVAILEEQLNGGLFHDGKEFKIHTT